MKKQLLLLLMILLPMVASADAVEIDGIWYNLVSKMKSAEVAKNPSGKYSGAIVIPEKITYDGTEYRVTSIGNIAFRYCTGLTSVTIGNSVTSIGASAFGDSYNLTSITIPNSVTNIESSAFYNCSGLTSVHITDLEAWCKISFRDNLSNPLYYAHHLYMNGSEITNLTIPNSVTSIGQYAFERCSGLTSITIPNSVTSIGHNAFEGCSGLTSITIPNSVTSIGLEAFERCSGLTSITIPNSVTSIGHNAFEGCSGLTSITIPNSVTSIENSSFKGCSGLTSITIPGSVTSIGSSAFSGCSSLTSITIPGSVTSIGDYAFAKCPELTDVTCMAESVPNTSSSTFSDSYIEYATLHVPGTAIDAYKTTAPWSGFKSIKKIVMPKHRLTYIIDEEEYKSYEIEEGATITPEAAPTKEGYTFSGWSEIPEVMPDHDVTVTGSFIVNKYKLTYQINGEEYKTYEIEYGATINPEPEPTKEGYTFSGWSWIPSKMPAEDVVVTGSFTANKYKLTYMVDGSEYRVYNIECGSVITPEPVPFKDGYEFSGWSDLPEIMPAHDVTVTGTFTYLPPCEAPIISYENGNLIFECATEGVEFVSDITDSDIKTHYKAIIPLSATYTIKVYAQKEGYKKSEAVTATLCWIDSTPSMEGIENTKMTEIHSIPVLIHAQDGRISIDGIDNGITVSAYTISGFKAGMEKGKDGKAEIITTMQKGETAIVKIGEKAVKVMMQ